MNRTVKVAGTSFRTDKVAWVVKQGLTRRERLCKWGLLLGGLFFLGTVAWAKGTWMSLEALLAGLPLLVALGVRTTARLASTGDSAELYDVRLVQPGKEFEEAAMALKPECVEVKSPFRNYHYLVNPRAVHWFRPSYYVNLRPLWVVCVFALYAWLVSSGLQLPKWPGLAELGLLVYHPHTAPLLVAVAAFVAMMGLMAVLCSIKHGLRLASAGGVVERLFLYEEDRTKLLTALQQGWA